MHPLEEDTKSPPELVPRESEIAVLIAEDLMAADVVVTPPEEGGSPATVEGVLAKLKEAGIVYGIDQEAVQRAVDEIQRDRPPEEPVAPVRVAQGRPPVPGEDARIEYHPSLTEVGGRPRVLPDGTVNLFDLNLVHNVPKGTVLAVEIPPTRGEPGTNVYGIQLPARPGRDVWLKAGKGALLSQDRLGVTAAIDGHATLMYGEVAVTALYETKGDVGPETGNLEFIGSVVVRGNVQSGFRVKAEGDVEVQGGIAGGMVEAAGNVTVRYGITGGGHGRVVAGGAVKARFIEAAEVRAGTHVWATDGILQSRVEAGEGVEVLGRRGAIIGGRVTAKANVLARILGSPLGGATEIAVGAVPGVRQEMIENRKKQAELQETFRRTEQAIRFLADQDRRGLLPQEKRATLSKLVQAQEQLFSQMEALKARLHELEQVLHSARTAWVQAKETCYPGVRIVIGNAHYLVTESLQRLRFHLNEEHEVAVASL